MASAETWRGALPAAAAALAGAETVFVFTGSGMSAESGIPTFRGDDGLWRGVRAEDVATPEAFDRDPAFVWSWYRERILAHKDAKPHPGHKAVARLQKLYGRATIATQNVDLLHEAAGARAVLHLHGRLSHVRCRRCAHKEQATAKLLRRPVPPCPACGDLLRPDVVWFGEELPREAYAEASAAAASCDVALVVGASNLVFPAASLPLVAKSQGAAVIEVNPEPSALSNEADHVLQGAAGAILPELVRLAARGRRGKRS